MAPFKNCVTALAKFKFKMNCNSKILDMINSFIVNNSGMWLTFFLLNSIRSFIF